MSSNFEIYGATVTPAVKVATLSTSRTLPTEDSQVAVYITGAAGLTFTLPPAERSFGTIYYFVPKSSPSNHTCSIAPGTGNTIFGSSSPQTSSATVATVLTSDGVSDYLYMAP